MKYNNNSFTYGIECEGIFGNGLIDMIEDEGSFDLKYDSSVRYNNIRDKFNLKSEDITDDQHTEVNLGVYTNSLMLLKALKMFKNGENYWTDKSCGLHLHIKPKRRFKDITDIFWDYKLIKKLEKYAFSELCEHVQARKLEHFCHKYGGFDSFLYDYRTSEKYRFVHRHEQGTWEFRFFAPCEHKLDNMKKFLKYFYKEINKQKNKMKFKMYLDDVIQVKEKNIDVKVNERLQELELNI